MTKPIPVEDSEKWMFNDRFAWNYHMLTAPFIDREDGPLGAHWVLPLVHGHVDQASMFFYGQKLVNILTILQSSQYWGGKFLLL